MESQILGNMNKIIEVWKYEYLCVGHLKDEGITGLKFANRQ